MAERNFFKSRISMEYQTCIEFHPASFSTTRGGSRHDLEERLKPLILTFAGAVAVFGQTIVPIPPPPDYTVVLPSTPTPQSALVQFADTIFPHMAIGSGWDTTMVIVNLTAQTVNYRQYFFDQSGKPLQVTFQSIPQGVVTTSTAIMGTLPPDQSFNFLLLDQGQPTH